MDFFLGGPGEKILEGVTTLRSICSSIEAVSIVHLQQLLLLLLLLFLALFTLQDFIVALSQHTVRSYCRPTAGYAVCAHTLACRRIDAGHSLTKRQCSSVLGCRGYSVNPRPYPNHAHCLRSYAPAQVKCRFEVWCAALSNWSSPLWKPGKLLVTFADVLQSYHGRAVLRSFGNNIHTYNF